MPYETIQYDVSERILTLTLNRPDRLNAFTVQMRDELLDAFDRADGDDDVRVIIVTGAGRGFCAGADLGRGASTFDHSKRDKSGDAYAERDGGGVTTLRIFELTKPIIAAINGPAAGVGVTMTLPMDIRLASSEAKFGLVFTRRGIAMEAASSWFLPRLVGPGQALEWVMSGRVFGADEALAGGLVSEVLAPGALLVRAREIATEIAENTAPVSVAMNRQMIWRMLTAPHPMMAHRVDTAAVRALGAMDDAREGVQSFLEKRTPQFTGRPSEQMPEFYPWWSDPEFGPPKLD
jgi:enoyl-CoA hydratase/carnithine racemase